LVPTTIIITPRLHKKAALHIIQIVVLAQVDIGEKIIHTIQEAVQVPTAAVRPTIAEAIQATIHQAAAIVVRQAALTFKKQITNGRSNTLYNSHKIYG